MTASNAQELPGKESAALSPSPGSRGRGWAPQEQPMRNGNGSAAPAQTSRAHGRGPVPSAEARPSKDGSGRAGAAPVQTDRWTAGTCRGTRAAQPPAGRLRERGAGAREAVGPEPRHSAPRWDSGSRQASHSGGRAALRLLDGRGEGDGSARVTVPTSPPQLGKPENSSEAPEQPRGGGRKVTSRGAWSARTLRWHRHREQEPWARPCHRGQLAPPGPWPRLAPAWERGTPEQGGSGRSRGLSLPASELIAFSKQAANSPASCSPSAPSAASGRRAPAKPGRAQPTPSWGRAPPGQTHPTFSGDALCRSRGRSPHRQGQKGWEGGRGWKPCGGFGFVPPAPQPWQGPGPQPCMP